MDTDTIIEALTNEIKRLRAILGHRDERIQIIASYAESLCVAVHNERPQDIKEELADQLRRVIREQHRDSLSV